MSSQPFRDSTPCPLFPGGVGCREVTPGTFQSSARVENRSWRTGPRTGRRYPGSHSVGSETRRHSLLCRHGPSSFSTTSVRRPKYRVEKKNDDRTDPRPVIGGTWSRRYHGYSIPIMLLSHSIHFMGRLEDCAPFTRRLPSKKDTYPQKYLLGAIVKSRHRRVILIFPSKNLRVIVLSPVLPTDLRRSTSSTVTPWLSDRVIV